tara:strand:- start:36953 stop:37624 length:672 start_codon:yes stop_codon:yes gene_type:complete
MHAISVEWLTQAAKHKHLFNHEWLGERFFHLPSDMVALQEILSSVRPRTVVHTGVAAGGGPIFLASILELLGGDSKVLAIDPRPRKEGLDAIENHALGQRIEVVTCPSTSAEAAQIVEARIAKCPGPVVVVLDLTHTQEHVHAELANLAGFVSPGSYVVVLDTIMEYMPAEMFVDRPYGKGNNPATAVAAFLKEDDRFEVDYSIEDRLLMTLAPGGFLKRCGA